MTAAKRTLEGIYAVFSKAGLAEGTNAGTIKILAPNGAGVDFAIDGLAYHKADTDNIAMTALAVQADLTTCLYGVDINAAGAVALCKGTEVLTATLTAQADVLRPPEVPSGYVRLGLMKIVLSGGTFTSGTTDLSGTGVTDTFYDFIGGGPVRPFTS